ncbi:VRR-NUC domain-containing protein [Bradyrhizobium sp. 5.13L]
MGEADLMRLLQRFASQLGARLFRQNVGQAWVGKPERGNGRMVRLGPADVLLRNARPFHAGVAGMSDLGGWMPVQVTADMVGSTVAIYTQVEVKDGTRPTKEQAAWIEAVNKAGGRAGVAHNEAELAQIVRGNR